VPDTRRPVLVLSRASATQLLRTVMVAAITSTLHGVPSKVIVGIEHGLKRTSAVNLDHVRTTDRSRLEQCVGHLDEALMASVCRALAVATGCEDAHRDRRL
jgi:mRNA interferase MazF